MLLLPFPIRLLPDYYWQLEALLLYPAVIRVSVQYRSHTWSRVLNQVQEGNWSTDRVEIITAPSSVTAASLSLGSDRTSTAQRQSTEQVQDQNDDQDQAEDPDASARPPFGISVISAAAAKQKQQNENQE